MIQIHIYHYILNLIQINANITIIISYWNQLKFHLSFHIIFDSNLYILFHAEFEPISCLLCYSEYELASGLIFDAEFKLISGL